MATRKEQAERTKQKILDAALGIVREEGIHSLSSLKIVEAAGISKGGFFHHFPQIEDLYLYLFDQLIRQFDEEIAPVKFDNIRDFIRSSTSFTMELLDVSPENVTMLFYFLSQCRHKPDYQKRLEMMIDGMFARWTNDISHFFPAGLSHKHKDAIIRILDMFFVGFSFHYLILEDKARYLEICDDFADMIISFIEKPAASPPDGAAS